MMTNVAIALGVTLAGMICWAIGFYQGATRAMDYYDAGDRKR